MPKNQKRSPGAKASQKTRTSRNKVKKYKKLLEENPNSPHRSAWEREVKHNS